jgi:hypothetical protein
MSTWWIFPQSASSSDFSRSSLPPMKMVGANIENHNKRASQWYRDYHADSPSLQRFPVEILEGILEFLTLKSGRLMPITNRASLSVESFSSIANSLPEDSTQIRQFVRASPRSQSAP